MTFRKILFSVTIAICSLSVEAQTFSRDFIDPNDSFFVDHPISTIYSPDRSLIVSNGGSVFGYNYLICLNSNGDTLWTKRTCLDSNFKVFSVAQLHGNRNYVIAGSNYGDQYKIRQFDTLGHYVSEQTIGSYGSARIKVIAGTGNDFYLLYGHDSSIIVDTSIVLGLPPFDSTVLIDYVKKLDNFYNELWSGSYRYGYVSYTSLTPSSAIDYNAAVFTSDSGLAFVRWYDTAFVSAWNVDIKPFLRRLDGNGNFISETDIDGVLGIPCYAYSITSCGDSGIIITGSPDDSLTFYDFYLGKISPSGSLSDFHHMVNDSSMAEAQGFLLSNGNYMFTNFTGTYANSPTIFSFFDNHLNYLYSMPSPFENNLLYDNPHSNIAPNICGGVLMSSQAGTTDWHLAVVNFDSLFHAYPSYVTGTVYQDNNNDCIDNSGDLNIGGTVVSLHDAITGEYFYGYTNSYTGYYSANVPYGNYTVSYTPSFLAMNECGGFSYNITSDSILTNANFADTLIPSIKDLQLWLYSTCIQPGYPSYIFVGALNNGSVTVDTTFNVILDSHVSYVASIPAPVGISGDTLKYHITLLSDSFTYFNISVLVSTGVSIGDCLTFSANSLFPDNVVITDDSAVYNDTVVGSYDPNSMSVNQPLYFHRNNTMIYTVEFQNTGNYMARNVVVVDTLDSHLDPATFKFINANPAIPVLQWFSGNKIYFEFFNINLPDSASNPIGSIGKFTYSIRTRSTAHIGDTIFNRASIYFDYNSPVVTNTTVNILGAPSQPNRVEQVVKKDAITLFPNPTSGNITILLPQTGDVYSIAVTDITGRVILENADAKDRAELQLTAGSGVYFVKITDLLTREEVTKKVVVTGR